MNDEVKRKERLNEIRWNGREMRKEKQSEKVKEQEKKKVKFNVSIQWLSFHENINLSVNITTKEFLKNMGITQKNKKKKRRQQNDPKKSVILRVTQLDWFLENINHENI